jgi:NDP-sugar pyrophosphorylase family protein
MEAMILAAGLGTRLRPLTDDVPKALIDIGGMPIIEHVARRLIDAGAHRLIINTHPHAALIREFVRGRDDFGVEVQFSHEPDAPLDTAGGVRHARGLFHAHEPFFLHNCDIYTDVDLRALYDAHMAAGDERIATLAVLPPSRERFLIFDANGLCGYGPRSGGEPVHVREPDGAAHRRDFAGIHVCSPALLDAIERDPAPNIITHYLRLARTGVRIERHDNLAAAWIDIGTHEKLASARRLHRTATGLPG